MANHVLITGGAGFIGCALSTALLERGHEVTVVDVLHPQVHAERRRPRRLPEAAELLPFDVTHAQTWDALLCLRRPDVVVHLAAETGTGQSLTEASRHGSVNVVGTTQMIDAFVRAGHLPERIVLATSRAVYGEGTWEASGVRYHPLVRPHDMLAAGRWDPPGPDGTPGRPLPSSAADTPPHPTSVYAATKLSQEYILQDWGAAMGVRTAALRLQNVYGPGQSLTNSYTGVLTLFARLADAGTAINVYEDGAITRDFVHVDDVVRGLVAAVERPLAEDVLVDIGSGSPSLLVDVARMLAGMTGAPEPYVSGDFRDGDVRAAYCDVSAAGAALGYAPERRLEDGLRELLEWVREGVACPVPA